MYGRGTMRVSCMTPYSCIIRCITPSLYAYIIQRIQRIYSENSEYSEYSEYSESVPPTDPAADRSSSRETVRRRPAQELALVLHIHGAARRCVLRAR